MRSTARPSQNSASHACAWCPSKPLPGPFSHVQPGAKMATDVPAAATCRFDRHPAQDNDGAGQMRKRRWISVSADAASHHRTCAMASAQPGPSL
jgi:hypothetical protein